jgi:hypothetical protein
VTDLYVCSAMLTFDLILAELQSLLLRLSILLATSLSTLYEPLPPTIVSEASTSKAGSSSALSAQILNDVTTLLTSLQKACTNLTLALRPGKASKQEVTPQPGEAFSPLSGLDTASMEAAKAQLTDMTKDYIPKLTWLCRKASSEAIVYRYIPKTPEDMKKEQEERDFVISKGGHIVQHPHSREKEKLEKIGGRGLGETWSKHLVSIIVELHEALGELSETFMSDRTLQVLKKASDARAKADGRATSTAPTASNTDRDLDSARQRALQATAVVWQVCDTALKWKLPKDNRAAVRVSWKKRTEVLQDALAEFRDALQGGEDGAQEDDSEDEDDPLAGLQDMHLSDEEKKRAAKYEPLLKAGCQLHSKAGELLLGGDAMAENDYDFDELESAGVDFSEAMDEVVSSLLYAGELNGSDEEDDEEEVESEVKDSIESFEQAIQRITAAAMQAPKCETALAPYLCQIEKDLANLSP